MLNIEEIIKKFSEISGMEYKKACLYRDIAEFSADETESKLKKEIIFDEKAVKKLTYLAATILNYRYLMLTGNGNTEIASCGKILNGGLDLIFSAKQIKATAMEDCKEYINDDDFVFERINANE